MTSVVDVWRAVDPDAILLAGATGLARPVRGVHRTRAAPPHLPQSLDAGLLVVDGVLAGALDDLLATLRAAEMAPAAILVAGAPGTTPLDDAAAILASTRSAAELVDRAEAYLADERGWLASLSIELRLACAEAALADPDPGTAAGLVAARMRRGVAVSAEGELRTLHARPAGRALAARFAAIHGRLLTQGNRSEASRRTRDGLWLMERRIRPGASVWLFDDLPFAAADELAADAAAVTLRALLRRPLQPTAAETVRHVPAAPVRAAAGDPLAETLLAVARHNGRVAPAARALGVHRNTVLYRLRRALAERDLDPRRPQDALRILAESDRDGV